MLIIVTGARFLRTPVNLCDDDWICVNNWHLIVELLYLFLRGRCHILSRQILVVTTIPTIIVMHGITNILPRDRVLLIIGITALPPFAGHPDDTLETVGADLVHDGLEEVMQCFL